MPKLKWCYRNEPEPKAEINYLAALLRQRRIETGKSAAKVAEVIGCTEENVRCQMNKPGKQWQVGKLMEYCDVLGIPYAAAFEAATK